MKLFLSSLLVCFFLFSCNSNDSISPKEFAEMACDCIKLSKDTSEEGARTFQECNSKNTELLSAYRLDTAWMAGYRSELMKILKDCLTE